MARSTREEWAKRVRRWQRSGLTAKQFEARTGIKASTLSYWKWRLGKDGQRAEGLAPRRSQEVPRVEFVEFQAAAMSAMAMTGIDVVAGRYVVRVGAGFDAVTLGQVLDALEQRG
jgi:transposase